MLPVGRTTEGHEEVGFYGGGVDEGEGLRRQARGLREMKMN